MHNLVEVIVAIRDAIEGFTLRTLTSALDALLATLAVFFVLGLVLSYVSAYPRLVFEVALGFTFGVFFVLGWIRDED